MQGIKKKKTRATVGIKEIFIVNVTKLKSAADTEYLKCKQMHL